MPEKTSNEIEIPEEIWKLLDSEDTAVEIARICFENGIKEEEKFREVGYQTSRVLLGDLPPEDFEKVLSEKVNLSSFSAKKIAREIYDSIFYPVRESLAMIYKKEVTPKVKPAEKREEKPATDVYREPIE
jgi:hypothetical protein